ncbi:S41 family peptidase [Anaerotardibacter muris]|uniref:S41 family peptidase n=1 Tax=Anaerotardibacter muris TaxID=2941505 RepID=UPI00203DC4A0|nr:S41 family peptidase [Anaerotardibacter muris]
MQRPSEKKQTQVIQKRNASIIKIVGVCIALIAVFVAGFALRGNSELLELMGFSNLTVQQEVNPGETVSGNTYDSLSARVAEVQGIIADDSVDTYDLTAATTATLDAFIKTMDDPYARYFDAASYQTYLNSVTNPSSGIGVLFGENDGSCYAVDVFEGSEAANMGVLPGDYIEAIDGEKKDQWSMPEVTNTISRDEGEVVYITWRRPGKDTTGGGTTFNTSLHYVDSPETNITYSVSNNTGYIEVKQIGSDCAEVLKKTIEQAEGEGAQSIVLDLRNIPGGYLTQAIEIASLFIQSGTVVQIKSGDNTSTKTVDGGDVTNVPLVVLVNDKTAGSAEVLAAALQDSHRAIIVGVQTQGKGSVQVMQPLSFGGALRYTAATYLSPSGRAIDGVGVTPDVVISNTDRQVPIALEIAASNR